MIQLHEFTESFIKDINCAEHYRKMKLFTVFVTHMT